MLESNTSNVLPYSPREENLTSQLRWVPSEREKSNTLEQPNYLSVDLFSRSILFPRHLILGNMQRASHLPELLR